jgi:hypothetical protein
MGDQGEMTKSSIELALKAAEDAMPAVTRTP